jgi:hypothetical protein
VIQVEFKLKTGPQGHIYLPKKIRQTFGENLTLLPNSNAAVMFSENASPETVIRSLRVIISDLQLRVGEKKCEAQTT